MPLLLASTALTSEHLIRYCWRLVMASPAPAVPPSSSPAPPASTLPDTVLRALRSDLIRGLLRPGEPIRADAVATSLGVSVIPVREALRVLLAEGRLTYVPHRGYRVATLSFEEIEEIFLICRVLEGEAARRGIPVMADAAVERMRELLGRLEAAAAGQRPDEAVWELVQVHQSFHFVPIEAAGLPRLAGALRGLWDHTAHYRTLYLFAGQVPDAATHADHRSLLDACAAGDAEQAVRVMDSHRDHVLDRIRRVVPRRQAP
jgi:DNA-binding GntR family transcriptional regulator